MADPVVEEIIKNPLITIDAIVRATRFVEYRIRILEDELKMTNLELDSFKERIKANQEKIKLEKNPPYLVGNIVEKFFLPVVRLVDLNILKPGDLVGVNKHSYQILEILPSEYDSSVKAMEVIEKPTEDYNSIGGLYKQIEELVEAIVLPLTHKDRFQKLRIRSPKGVLLYGPPGTGKTLLTRACAAQTNATFSWPTTC